jgi:trehalose 6-phosphate phosphatase
VKPHRAGGILRPVPAPSDSTLAESLRPLTEDPERAAIFCDIDGVLAPIVSRADEAKVPEEVSVHLGRLGRRYGLVACVSGRSAAEARRLVGVGSIAYAGSHGAELLETGSAEPAVMPEFAEWEDRVRAFAAGRDSSELRKLRVRIEDKGPIAAFHWRDVPDADAALSRIEAIAAEAEADGLATHWGRKVLEVRPPVRIGKDQAVRDLIAGADVRTALFGGDDTTDLDAFHALAELAETGTLDSVVRVGVRSDEGPPEIVERADVVVDGVRGFARVLSTLAET